MIVFRMFSQFIPGQELFKSTVKNWVTAYLEMAQKAMQSSGLKVLAVETSQFLLTRDLVFALKVAKNL